jgi:hypothetical protein
MSLKRMLRKLDVASKGSRTGRNSARQKMVYIVNNGRIVPGDRFCLALSSDMSPAELLLREISDACSDNVFRAYERHGIEDLAVESEAARRMWESRTDAEFTRHFDKFLKHHFQRIYLPQAAMRIANAYNIKDVDAHYMLLQQLGVIRDRFLVNCVFKPDSRSWAVPDKVTTWKTARRKLLSLGNKLRSMERPLREIARDQVLLGALLHIDRGGRQFQKFVTALFALAYLVQAAAEIEGKKGRRPHPSWRIKATQVCRKFWRTQMHEEPKPYFKEDTTIKPGNDFSRWFYEVMYDVADLTPSECNTILARK